MTLYVVVRSGQFTDDSGNTGQRTDLISAHRDYQTAQDVVKFGNDIPKPEGWGVTVIDIKPVELV